MGSIFKIAIFLGAFPILFFVFSSPVFAEEFPEDLECLPIFSGLGPCFESDACSSCNISFPIGSGSQ